MGTSSPSGGGYSVLVEPPIENPHGSMPYAYDSMAPWEVPNETMYMATGLDRAKTYTVNLSSTNTTLLERVVVFDAFPQYVLSILDPLARSSI